MEWSFHTAEELVSALRAGAVTSVELTDEAIARIERDDEVINAICVPDFDRARAAAHRADEALARREDRPLLGVPVTVKESYNIAGLPTTWGMPPHRDYLPAEDAVQVSRLKAAGAVVLGKTNVPLGLQDIQSFNEIYGTTNNPWDHGRTSGGSSGGSAAALASGFGALSIGSDIAGSLRTPAHFCGVYAHKPTLGLAAARGMVPPVRAGFAGRARPRRRRSDGVTTDRHLDCRMAGIPCVDEARARVPLFHDAFPTRMGAVPTAVLAERDRARSGHPQASVAAIGAAAKDITGYQPFAYALGAESPFRRLYELDARILLLGVGHNRNSFLRGSGSKRRTSATTTTRTSRASGPSGPNAAWLGVRSSAPPAARWWRPCRSSTSRGGSENSCGSEPGTRECPRPSWVPPWCRPPALKEDR